MDPVYRDFNVQIFQSLFVYSILLFENVILLLSSVQTVNCYCIHIIFCPYLFCINQKSTKFRKFTGMYPCCSLFLNKVEGLRSATLLKKRHQHRCFPMNFANFLRKPYFKEHLQWLLPRMGNPIKLST